MTIRHAVLLFFLMICGFLVVGQLYVTIPLVSAIASRFEVEPASAAFVGSAFGFAYASGFLIFGPMSDRYGRRKIILLGLVATAVATMLVAFTRSFDMLLAARALQGLVASAFPPAALSLLSEELPAEQRPFGVSLMSFAFLGAAPLAQFFAVKVGGELPTIMMALAPLYILGAVGLFLSVKNDGTLNNAAAGTSSGPRSGFLFADVGILAAWAAAITVLFGFVSFHSGAQALGTDLGVDLQTLRLVGVPPVLLTFVAVPLTRRFGPSVTARIGLGLSAVALCAATIATPNILLGASALLSTGVAFSLPGLIATVAGRASEFNRGFALAMYTFCLFVGASLAPPLSQILAGIGITPLWLIPALLQTVAIIGLTFSIRHPAVKAV